MNTAIFFTNAKTSMLNRAFPGDRRVIARTTTVFAVSATAQAWEWEPVPHPPRPSRCIP